MINYLTQSNGLFNNSNSSFKLLTMTSWGQLLGSFFDSFNKRAVTMVTKRTTIQTKHITYILIDI